jgi:hypothetical protein
MKRFLRVFITFAFLTAVLFSSASFAADNGHLIAEGELDAYFIASSGPPVPGEHSVLWDGDHFFVCETTAERMVKGWWFSPEGQLLYSETLADLSHTEGDLSQPSACVLDGIIYVGYVAREVQDAECGVQYLCTTRYRGSAQAAAGPLDVKVIKDSQVWPRKPAMAACPDGIMMLFRNHENKSFACFIDKDTLAPGPVYQLYKDEWDEYGGSFSIYPSIAYAENTDVFLAAWDAGSTVRGAVLTAGTSETPESFEIFSGYYEDFEQPRTASDGNGFCVCAHSSSGISTALIDQYGNVEKTQLSVLLYDDDINDGQLEWDGNGWLISYSRSISGREYSKRDRPDFRHVDSFICRLDSQTLGVSSVTDGLATAWWHQLHSRFATGGEGQLFCTYINDGGGTQTLRWCVLNGAPADRTPAELQSSGLVMEQTAFEYDNPVACDSDGNTAYALFGPVFKRTYSSGWEILPGSMSTFSYYDMDTAGGHVMFSGWAGFVTSLKGEYDGSCGDWTDSDIEMSSIGSGKPATGIYVTEDGDAFICASEGTIWHKAPGNSNPALVYDLGQTGTDFHDIDGNSKNDIYAAGDRGTLLHYNGSSWSTVATPGCVALNAVWPDGKGSAFIAGDSGTVLKVKNGAVTQSWRLGDGNLQGIWGFGEDMVFACGDLGTVLMYDGAEWKTVALPDSDSFIPESMHFTEIFGLEGGDRRVLYVTDITRYDGAFELNIKPAGDSSGFDVWLEGGKVRYTLGSALPEDCFVYAATYSEEGRMTGLDYGYDGRISLWGEGPAVKVFFTDSSFTPLREAVTLER